MIMHWERGAGIAELILHACISDGDGSIEGRAKDAMNGNMTLNDTDVRDVFGSLPYTRYARSADGKE